MRRGRVHPVRVKRAELGGLSVEDNECAESERETEPKSLRTLPGNKLSHALEDIDRMSTRKLRGPYVSLLERAAAFVESAEYFDCLLVRDVVDRGAWHLLIEHFTSPVEPRKRRNHALRVPAWDQSKDFFRLPAEIVVWSAK